MKGLLIALAAVVFAAGVAVALFGFYVMFTAGPDPLFLRLWAPATGFLLSLPVVIAWKYAPHGLRPVALAVLGVSAIAGVYVISQLGSIPMS